MISVHWMNDAALQMLAPAPLRVEDCAFTVLDLETTGGKPPEHRVTEIACYRVEKLKIIDRFTTLVNPQRSIPAFVSNLTGITDAMLAGQPRAHEVLEELLKFIGDSVVVAHHSEFDRRFLGHEMKLAGFGPLLNDDLCTCKLARRILPWLPSKSLGNLASFFGIEQGRRHRADGDAHATGELLLVLLNYLSHRGIDTLEDVLLFQHGEMDYRR